MLLSKSEYQDIKRICFEERAPMTHSIFGRKHSIFLSFLTNLKKEQDIIFLSKITNFKKQKFKGYKNYILCLGDQGIIYLKKRNCL